MSTYDEEVVPLITDSAHSNGCCLTDHGVERKADHAGDRDTLRSSAGIEDLSGNNPGKRTASATEGKIVKPSHGNETPRRTVVADAACRGRRIGCKYGSCNDERDHVAQVTEDKRPTTSSAVDEEDGTELSNKGNDRVDSLVFEGFVTFDTDESIDRDRVVLDRTDTSHLDGGLKSAGNKQTTEA